MTDRFVIRVAGVIAIAGLSTGALAQAVGPYGGPYTSGRFTEGRSGYGGAARYCPQMCDQDVTPCDPPEFKRADGRCTNPVSGGGIP